MLISDKYKFLIIDIPKTGSRSLRESFEVKPGIIQIYGKADLNAKFYQHGTSQQAKNALEINEWRSFYKATIVRNPWDRYLSFLKYFSSYAEKYISKDKSIQWNTGEKRQGKMCVDLISSTPNESELLKKIILSQQAQDCFYKNELGNIQLNKLCKFENLNEEFEQFCKKVGLQEISLLHKNKSQSYIDAKKIYTQEIIDLVALKESSVIKLMGYDFPKYK